MNGEPGKLKLACNHQPLSALPDYSADSGHTYIIFSILLQKITHFTLDISFHFYGIFDHGLKFS